MAGEPACSAFCRARSLARASALVPCTRRFSVADTQPRALPHVPFSQRRRRACTGDPHPPRLALCVHAGGQTHLPRPRTAPVTASPPRQRCIWPMPPDGGPYAPPQLRNAAAGDYVTAAGCIGGGRVCLAVAGEAKRMVSSRFLTPLYCSVMDRRAIRPSAEGTRFGPTYQRLHRRPEHTQHSYCRARPALPRLP